MAPLNDEGRSVRVPEGHVRALESEMAKTNPFQFLQQVRAEASKVTWPTRKETTVTTAMVFVMVVLASLFFLVVDQVMGWAVRLVLGVGA